MSIHVRPTSSVHRRPEPTVEWIAQAYAPSVGDWIAPPEIYASSYTLTDFPANSLAANLILLQRRMRFDRIGIYVAGAGGAGAEARLGVYEVDWKSTSPIYYPTDLILDAGAVSCEAAGTREISIDLTLDRGWYALAFVTNDGTIDLTYRRQGLGPLGGTSPNVVITQGWFISQAYGPLPDPFPAGAARYGNRFVAVRVAELL